MGSVDNSVRQYKNRRLVIQLKAESKKAFKEIYEEYYEMLLSISIQYVSDREEAKEAVQNAFIKLWENRTTILDNTNLKNFLYTIVKNNSLNYLKKQEFILRSREDLKWMEMHYQYESMSRLGFDSVEFSELKNIIEEAVGHLPGNCRTVFKMSRFEYLMNKEIAQKLQITEKTVEAHLTKALKLLKSDLRPYLSLIFSISNILS
ncbi:RNA polymerase sigma-70 factor [Saccharicrinis sp. GN24d3]|uniref:RNA polymerase sigma-70 factor n=1 Tax=Saccharicrinis sp. GN24d3 TaxID=3458416 RepID=UPI0040373AE5